jgi:DNA polymerase (family 10)
LNNRSIINLLHLIAKLLSLHGANSFQIKHYTNAALFLERLDKEVSKLSPQELRLIPGINNSVIALIEEIQTTGSLHRYQELIKKTPEGILTMLELAGLGPKKVSMLWQKLGIQDIKELEEACKLGKVAQLPGFGEKTQTSILESLAQRKRYLNKFHYAAALTYVNVLETGLNEAFPNLIHTPIGDFRRKLEIVTTIDWLIAAKNIAPIVEWLCEWKSIQQIKSISGPFSWRGYFVDNNLPLHILFCPPEDFYKELIIQTGSTEHLGIMLENGKTLGQQIKQSTHVNSEAEGYQQAGFPYIFPELREGIIETSWVKSGAPMLLEATDLKGIFHSHTTYSDGQNSLESMAKYCKDLGYSYIGITDHSQSAAYAGGLRPITVQEQHNSIDGLNQQLAPFKIFKGIESDILPDGSLDYPDEILSKFDFIIASVHMGLSMNEQQATDRLIKAISNPFTTMLGHPTGRLLLKREGYPINHRAVIDACAAYGVIIEINANPWRLDLDWRWIPYAIEKGVKLSINPDAHHQDEISNIRYGVYMGRKGGLTKQHTFNALTQKEVEIYFQKRKILALQAMQNS